MTRKTIKRPEFQAPMSALFEIYEGIAGKPDVVSIAWEREGGKIYRYDLPIPRRLDPVALRAVAHVVERIATTTPLRWSR